jgi:hypothetical protein
MINTSIPIFGELVDCLQLKLIIYFRKYHNGLPFRHSAYGLLASQGVIGLAATQSCNILVSYQFLGSGSQVLQDLVCLYHPGHCDTQAASFLSVKGATPLMPSHVTARNQLSTLMVYFMVFGNWEAHLKVSPALS